MGVLFAIIRIALIFFIIFIERKKPGEAIIWVALVFFFPVLGALLYLIFGSTLTLEATYFMRNRKIYGEYREIIKEEVRKQHSLLEGPEGDTLFESEQEKEVMHFVIQYCQSLVTQWNKAEIITSGEDKYQRLLQDIAAAQDHIHLAYYSIHNDHVGKEVVDALTIKAQQGVVVRVLFDGVGGIKATRRFFKPLTDAGGQVKRIKPLLTHFRYHRKIVVIDGRIGYTGGMNIGAKYKGENSKKSPWRDTQVRLEGEAVYYLQYYFLFDWLCAKGSKSAVEIKDSEEALFPEMDIKEKLPCQIIASGIGREEQISKMVYLRMLSIAQKKIVIQSPYFIPSASLLEALKVALASGVEVQLMLPQCKSNFFLDPTTRYFVAQLVPLGLKVFYYEGYVHAKTLRVDDALTCIGSINIDVRSLEVSDEICAIFFDKAFARKYDEVLAQDFMRCKEMEYATFLQRSPFKRFAERVFVLFSPLM